jgi:gliding motility-associated lipoprotein GldH
MVKFIPVLEDSIAVYNMQLTVRHTDRYAYQNLWLFVDVKHDSELLRRDTIEAMVANDRGEWLGSGVSKYTLPLLYVENVQLQNGEYEVVVQQGMREEVLQGITDLGLKVIRN